MAVCLSPWPLPFPPHFCFSPLPPCPLAPSVLLGSVSASRVILGRGCSDKVCDTVTKSLSFPLLSAARAQVRGLGRRSGGGERGLQVHQGQGDDVYGAQFARARHRRQGGAQTDPW